MYYLAIIVDIVWLKPTHCHQCHSLDLSTKGFGTEQVELELKKISR